MGRNVIGAVAMVLAAVALPAAATAPVLRVAYAGSMGAVMDHALGPRFAHAHEVEYQGIGRGSYALSRLLAARQLRADVFVAATSGPIDVLERAGRVKQAVPIASTAMVVIYSPKSRFAKDFAAAARGDKRWYEVLREPGLRFGRSDPAVDPQGANALLTLKLAARFYRQPQLLAEIAGAAQNPRQIFAEASLMSRLEAGQIDATIGYASAAKSRHLPTVGLPPEINLADPEYDAAWYSKVALTLAGGKRLRVRPLLFYAAVLDDAGAPRLARAFVDFLQSDAARGLLRKHGYGPAHGGPR